MFLLLRWLINTVALFIVAQVIPGITYSSLPVLAAAALVLGLLNAVVKPILFWLTLPLTILTLGLFLIVLNAIMLALTAWVVPGFQIDGVVSALLGAVILGVISLLTSWIGKDRKNVSARQRREGWSDR